MLNLRLARFEHLVDIGRVAELRGIERRNGSLVVGAGDARRRHRARPDGRRRRAAARRGRRRTSATSRSATGARSAARWPTPTRPPSTRPWPSPSTPRSTLASARRHPHGAGRRLLRRRVVDRARGRRAADGRSPSRCGPAAAGSASPSSPAATATSPSPARSPPSQLDDRRRRQPRARSPCSASAGAPVRATARRGRAHRPAVGADIDAAERRSRWPSTTSTTSPTTRRCRRPTAAGSARRWSPTPGDGPSTTLGRSTTMTEPMTVRADRQRRRRAG